MKAIAPVTTPVLVEIVEGHPTTTSLDVAAHFGKRHDTVLRAVRQLECTPEFHARNFAEMILEIEIGNGATRSSPAFRMTRDGFTFLCMGFTGKEAAKWKEAYISAFNQLERQVRSQGMPEIYYPIERWLAHGPQRPRVQGELPGVFVTADMFDDLPSPTLALLADLRREGYSVDACMVEVQALKHHLAVGRDLMRLMRARAGDALSNGVRLMPTPGRN